MFRIRRPGRAAISIVAITSLVGVFGVVAAAAAALAAPDLVAASDTGSSSTDNVTKDNTPTFEVGGAETGETVELHRDGVLVDSGTKVADTPLLLSDDDAAVADDTYDYTVVRGEETSAATAVTVDTTVPGAPVIDLMSASDTGRLSSDNITTTLIQGTATYNQALVFLIFTEASATVTWSAVRSGVLPVAGAQMPAPSVAGPGIFSGLHITSLLNTIPPTSGVYTYSSKQTDLAGNQSTATATLNVTLDVAPPAPATVDLDAGSDSFPAAGVGFGLTDADDITSSTKSPLTINVQTEKDAFVDIIRDGSPVGTRATADSAGKAVVIDDAGFTGQTSNMHGYVAQVEDVAGNVNKQGYIPVFVDTENPGAANKLDLVVASDTGTDNADDITKDNTPTFLVTGAEDNALVELFRCPGAAVCTAANRIGPLASRLGNGEITAPLTADNSTTSVPPNTSWRFTTRQTDASGRVSSVMGVNVNIVVDTTPLAAPSQPVLIEPGDLQAASAQATGSVSPTFMVDSGAGRVQLLRHALLDIPVGECAAKGGVVLEDRCWTVGIVVDFRTAAGELTDEGPVGAGTYMYTARSVDTAGNESDLSLPTEVKIQYGGGYWLVGSDGGVFAFGDAGFFGSTGGMTLNAPILTVVPTPTKKGYWLLGQDGGVFAFGDAGFYGSMGGVKVNSPIVGMVATKSGKGYWLFAADGGVFTFGDAPFHGAPASEPQTSPIVAMVAAPDGRGYWLVAKNGKVFAYGSASPIAGLEAMTLNSPIVGIATTPSGSGLWLVAADGGVFALGDAKFLGGAGGMRLNSPITAITALPTGDGYYLLAGDGGVFAYGKALFHGSTGGMRLNQPVVGMAAS